MGMTSTAPAGESGATSGGAVKTAAQSVTNSTTFVDDTHLTFAVGANETWSFVVALRYNAPTAADIKTQFSLPAGAVSAAVISLGAQVGVADPTNTTAAIGGASTTALAWGGVGTNFSGGLIVGSVTTGATPGSVTLQWAQNTANATPTTVLAGSSVTAWLLA